MTFARAGATLALASASKFAATITGFAAGDVIDLLATTATSATLGAGDILTIMDRSHAVASLQLAGTYTGYTFAVASDHHGGADITTNAPGLWPTAVTLRCLREGFCDSYGTLAMSVFQPEANGESRPRLCKNLRGPKLSARLHRSTAGVRMGFGCRGEISGVSGKLLRRKFSRVSFYTAWTLC